MIIGFGHNDAEIKGATNDSLVHIYKSISDGSYTIYDGGRYLVKISFWLDIPYLPFGISTTDNEKKHNISSYEYPNNSPACSSEIAFSNFIKLENKGQKYQAMFHLEKLNSTCASGRKTFDVNFKFNVFYNGDYSITHYSENKSYGYSIDYYIE